MQEKMQNRIEKLLFSKITKANSFRREIYQGRKLLVIKVANDEY